MHVMSNQRQGSIASGRASRLFSSLDRPRKPSMMETLTRFVSLRQTVEPKEDRRTEVTLSTGCMNCKQIGIFDLNVLLCKELYPVLYGE